LIFLSVVLFVLLWEFAASMTESYVFPNLTELGSALLTVARGGGGYDPLVHYSITAQRIAISFVLALGIGVPLGVFMGLNRRTESFLSVYVLILLSFPSIVVAFVGSLWFGLTTYVVPVFVGFVICVPYAIINAWEGTADLDQETLEMAEAFDAGSSQTWRSIILPYLLPYLFATMRIVLAVAWKIMLVAEIFGSQSGVGFVVNDMFIGQRNDMIMAWALPMMFGVLVVERGLKKVEERQFAWRPETATGTEEIV
jgi:NitT/TauT family transport system permease protein